MSLFKSSLIISILTLLGSVVSFINQVVIAYKFGTSLDMDTYLLITSFPFLISGVVSSAFSFSLIPHFVTKSFDYFLYFLKIVISVLIVFTIVSFFLYRFYIFNLYELNNITNINLLNVFIWLVFFVTIVFSIISCYFTSKSKFVIPAFLNFLPFIFSIICILLNDTLGVISIVMGLFLGYLLAIFYSMYVLWLNKSDSEKQYFDKKSIFIFLKSMKFSLLSMLTFSIFQVIDAYWGNKLADSSISYLGYAQRIVIAIGSLVISGPSSVLIPRLTLSYSEGNLNSYYNDSALIIKLTVALTSFAALICSFYSYDIIKILFERGNFNDVSTQNVSNILPYMLCGMVFMLCVVISFRSLFVKKASISTSMIGLLTLSLYFILSGFLSRYLNLIGIAYAYISTWLIIFIITTFVLFRKRYKTFIMDFVFFSVKHIIILSVIYITNLLIDLYIIKTNILHLIPIVYIAISSVISFLLYLLMATKVFKIDEIIFLKNKFSIFRK